MASMRETSPGVWRLRVELGTNPATGRHRQKAAIFRGGKRAAQKALADLQHRADLGEFDTTRPVDAHHTISDVLAEWQHSPGFNNLAASTRQAHRNQILRHLNPTFGRLHLDTLTTLQIEAGYQRLATAGVGASTISRAHSILRSALKWAHRHNMIATNPAALAEHPNQPRIVIRIIADHILTDALDLATNGAATIKHAGRVVARHVPPSPDFAMFLRLCAVTGARRAEVGALRWDDIDWDAATIRIVRQTHRDATKTGDVSARIAVPLGPNTLALLTEWRRACEVDAELFGWSWRHDTPLFRSPKRPDMPVHPQRWTHLWADVRAHLVHRGVAGVEGLELKQLRHTAATKMLAAGIDVVTVARILGHADPSTTLRFYGGFIEGQRRAAAAVLDATLAS